MWNALIINPIINILLWLYGLLGNSYGLAIIVFTALTWLILLPLTLHRIAPFSYAAEPASPLHYDCVYA